jgi:oxalate decarboxylase
MSRHVRSLANAAPAFESDLGALRRVDAETLPVLRNLSIKHLRLAPGAIREPHWHVNAAELTYCLSGEVLVSVLDTGSEFASFTVAAGQMFHIPSGSLHHIENIGPEPAELIVGFRHERPEDFSLRAAFGAMTDAVLGNTYDLQAAALAARVHTTEPAYIVARDGAPDIPSTARYGDPHRFDVEGESPPVTVPYGSARVARSQFWPALKTISMYSLRITGAGMREPHWHPVTGELGYVREGRARMTILDPDGTTDTYELAPGDVYFVPAAYPHQIEVLGEAIHFLIFFDQPMPADIGYRASGSALSPEVLAATLGAPLPRLPFTPADPLLVARANPLD